jgi:hypothetical protein
MKYTAEESEGSTGIFLDRLAAIFIVIAEDIAKNAVTEKPPTPPSDPETSALAVPVPEC